MRFTVACCTVGFATVTATVALGGFGAVDQWALDHAMPWLTPFAHPATFMSNVVPFTHHTPRGEIPAEVWLYPASVLLSALIVAGCCFSLWWKGERVAALAWSGAWVLGNAVEVVGKNVISRPTLHMTWRGGTVPMPTFDDSFPSGHAMRACLVAGLVAFLWPRLRAVAVVWLVVALPLLVVTNAHAPSDVLAAALLGSALTLICVSVPLAAAGRSAVRPVESGGAS